MISSGEIHRIFNMAQSLGASYIRSGVTYTVSFSLHGKVLAALSYCCMTTYKSQELTDLSLQCRALIKQFLKFLGNYSKKLQLRIASNICGALEISSIFSYDNLGLEVSLYKRSTAWFGCGWMFLPSFGMLLVLFALFFSSFLRRLVFRNNYDVCQDNPSCPLSPGRQVLEFTMDPSKLFRRLFRMIHYDMVNSRVFW